MREEYVVTVRAFDRVSTRRYWAESEEEVKEKALDEISFSVKVVKIARAGKKWASSHP